MNYFFRRVTSSLLSSLFSLSIGIGSVKPVDAQDTERLNFCEENKTLFHLDKGAERKVNLTVLDFQSNEVLIIRSNESKTLIEITGLASILESKLVKDNQLAVVKWNQIKPLPQGSQSIPPSLGQLRKIRHENGVESVIIVTVMTFETDKTSQGAWLLTKDKKTEEVDIKLNLQVIDTTTGEIVLEVQGNGNESGNTLAEVKLPFNVDINYGTSNKYDPNNALPNYRGYSIKFQLGGDLSATTISKSSKTIKQKLIALATEKAMNEITNQLNARSEELACLLRKPTLVADVNGNKITLNKGIFYGYCKEMTFSIERSPQPIIDPATGRVISMKTEKVGTIKLSEVEAQSSVGKIDFIEPGKSFQVKDIAKLTSDNNCPEEQDNAQTQNSLGSSSNQQESSEN